MLKKLMLPGVVILAVTVLSLACSSDGNGDGTPPPTTSLKKCDASYPTVCIPPPPPDLDCGQISYRNLRYYRPTLTALTATTTELGANLSRVAGSNTASGSVRVRQRFPVQHPHRFSGSDADRFTRPDCQRVGSAGYWRPVRNGTVAGQDTD